MNSTASKAPEIKLISSLKIVEHTETLQIDKSTLEGIVKEIVLNYYLSRNFRGASIAIKSVDFVLNEEDIFDGVEVRTSVRYS